MPVYAITCVFDSHLLPCGRDAKLLGLGWARLGWAGVGLG